MAANTMGVMPKSAIFTTLSLAAVPACTTRAPTATASLVAANIFELLPAGTEMRRIDWINVNAASNAIGAPNAQGLVQIWVWDGTTATLFKEIDLNAQTPSAVAKGVDKKISFSDWNIPATYKVFASTTVATTASTTAITVTLGGGEY